MNKRELPNGWATVVLDDFGTWTSGGTPSRGVQEYFSGAVPWFKTGELPDGPLRDSEEHISIAAVANSSAKLLPAGTVVMAMYGATIGRLGILEREGAVNQACAALLPSYHVTPKFALYFLMSERQSFRNVAQGAAQPNISQAVIKAFPAALAPLPEQHRIVAALDAYLSRLDAAAASLERARRNLGRYRASVLQAAVEGRLVPTEVSLARAESRDFEPAATLLARVLVERKQRWLASGKRGKYEEPVAPDVTGLPELPEGWCWGSGEQLCDFITKGTTPESTSMHTDPRGVPYIKVYNLTFDGSLNWALNPTYVERDTHEGLLARSVTVPGDVLMNIVGPPLGKVGIVPSTYPFWNINQAIARFRVLSPVNPAFFAATLRADPTLRWCVARSKATAGQLNLTLETCRSIPIALPPIAEQTRIVAEVDRLLSVAATTEATVTTQLARVQRLRQAVLKWAFEGKLVDQDPNDEPASVLLERIRAERAGSEAPGKRRGRGRQMANG